MQCNKFHGLVLSGLFLPSLASAATLNLSANWNLVGNSDTADIDVATRFSDQSKIVTVWKWDKTGASGMGKWAFYAPSMTSTELTNYATSKGYEVLTSIAPKEGFWVNAVASTVIAGDPMSAPPTPGSTAATLVATDLAEGWNLIASADNKNPSQINTNLSAGLAAFGKVLVTAWGWDVATSSWKFYAPALEAQGAETLSSYIGSKAYRSFAVAPAATDGFWVNVAPGGTTGTGLSPLYAAKDFVSTLRSNAMALDAADLSLQTELQAVSNDLKTRMVPVVDSNLDTLNLAWLAVQFWNDVVKNPNVPHKFDTFLSKFRIFRPDLQIDSTTYVIF